MTRRVGIEVEFAGLEFADAAQIIGRQLQSKAQVTSPHEYEFETTHGRYRLEVDFELLKRLSKKQHDAPDTSLLQKVAVEALELAASVATPLELVSPPLPFAEIDNFAKLLDALSDAGAKGTTASVIYAFGVHFNPSSEVSATSITAHLQAFLCLYEWLKARDDMDISRVLSAFAKAFPTDYERVVLAADYAPDADTLIDDYLTHNPTRNRALDMLPMFSEIDAPRVQAVVDDERVNARPTYHYRLPNCRLGDADWNVTQPWQDWLELESLAADAPRLARLCEQRLAYLDDGLFPDKDEWIATCQASVDDR